MNKNQKIAIGVSSSFAVIILGVLSLVSFAGPSPVVIPVASNSGAPVCEAQKDFWEYTPTANPNDPSDLGFWKQKADLGVPQIPNGFTRISAAAFSIGSMGYVATGQYDVNNTTVLTRDLWEWNGDGDGGQYNGPYYNTWTQKADLPIQASARSGAVGFSIWTKGYVGTGGNEFGGLQDFWEWDQTTNTWTKKADFIGAHRTGAVGFSIGGLNNQNKGYIGTGITANGLVDDFYEWDQTTNIWTPKASVPNGGRFHAVGFSIANKGYIGTGKASDGYQKDFYEWNGDVTDTNPVTGYNTWTQKTDVPGNERANAVGFSADSKGYVGTGASLAGREKDFYEYNPTADSWTPKADYEGGPTDQAFGFSIRHTGYIGAGFRCEVEPPVVCTPNSWNKKADFTGAGGGRWQAEGVSIATNGKGYIGMGSNATVSSFKDFYEWDPTGNTPGWPAGSGAWSTKASLPPQGPSRVDPVAFSIGSMAYMGTGGDGNNAYYKDFWEFNPAGGANGSGSWIQKASLPPTAQGRRSASGFAIGKKGYIGTGVNDNLSSTNHFKDFYEWNGDVTDTNPLTGYNTWNKKADFPGAARSTAVGFTIGTKGYMGTGADYSSSYSDFYEFNPSVGALGTWTKKTDFQGVTRGQAAGFSLVGLDLNTYGYIGTGAKNNYVQAGSALKDFWRFNPTGSTTGWPTGSGLWERKTDFIGTARINAAAFSLNNKGYIGTGLDYTNNTLNYTKDFYEYCPD